MNRFRGNRIDTRGLLASDVWRPVIAAAFSTIALYVADAIYRFGFGNETSAEINLAFSFLGFFLFGVAYGVLCYVAFGKLSAGELRETMKTSSQRDSTAWWKRWLRGGSGTVWALSFSSFAVIAVLTVSFMQASSRSDLGYVATSMGLATVVGAWFLNAVSYALHYAREDSSSPEPGFRFPDDKQPVWSDYTFVAFQVSTSFSTADVICATTERRRLITRHSLLSFAFNTVILAQLVSIINPN